MTLSIKNVPSSVDQSQEFQVDVDFSCPSCTSDSYLRGVFYPSGTSYFGYTQDNSGNWSNVSGGNCLTFFKITKTDLDQQGSWSGKLKVKLDMQNSYYSGPGEYLFKVGRYTSSCSSPLWSLDATIAITGPTPTLTPTPTNIQTPTSVPSSTNTPTPQPTLTPTSKPTQKPIVTISKELIATDGEVLGESSGSSETTQNFKKPKAISLSASNQNYKFFILLGFIFTITCGILIFQKIIKKRRKNNEEI